MIYKCRQIGKSWQDIEEPSPGLAAAMYAYLHDLRHNAVLTVDGHGDYSVIKTGNIDRGSADIEVTVRYICVKVKCIQPKRGFNPAYGYS